MGRSPVAKVERRRFKRNRSRSSDDSEDVYGSSCSRRRSNSRSLRRKNYSSCKKDLSEEMDLHRDGRRRRSRSRSRVSRSHFRLSDAHSRRQSSDRHLKSRSRSSSSADRKRKNQASDKNWNSQDVTEKEKPLAECDLEGKSPEEIAMLKVMGFCNFDSTNGKQVQGNMEGTVFLSMTRRKYRQYMNRRGGFNKPLDFTF